MDPLLQSQTFFLISSVGFVILGILVSILLYYSIRATRIFLEIMSKVEKDIDQLGDTTREMLEEVKESAVFHFLFRKKKKHRKN